MSDVTIIDHNRAERVHVIGASGRSGAALCRMLVTLGREVVPIVRNQERWKATGIDLEPRVADLTEFATVERALEDATHVVSTAHARFTPTVLGASLPQAVLVLLGSTRKFTRWLDQYGASVIAAEAAFLNSGRRGVMLHPTMIYGSEGEDNVQRIAQIVRHMPVLPIPEGGRALVQPIHQDDVSRAMVAALDRGWPGAHSVVIAGPVPVSYADFVAAVAMALGKRRPWIIGVPLGAAGALAKVATLFGLPRVQPAELRRLQENKAFSVEPMVGMLGFRPIPLSHGLRQTFLAEAA